MTSVDPNPWPYPRVFAHRGGGALAPENTIEALDVARHFGVGVEFDVMLGASGTPWVIHDETLERTTSGYGRVAETPDEVLAALDAGASHSAAFAGARVPRFEAVVRRCIDYKLSVNVEIKPAAGQDGATAEIVAAMADALWHNRDVPPLISSFSDVALRVSARVAPKLPRGLLVGRLPRDWLRRCRVLGVVSMHVNARHLRPEDLVAIKLAGLWVVAYTENDPKRAAQLFQWGVDCVITDRPDLILPPPG